MGVWGIAPRKNLKFNSANLLIVSTISRQNLPSVVFHSFTAYICSYHLRQKSALHFATSHNNGPPKSIAHLTKSTAHFVSENTILGPATADFVKDLSC